MYAIIPDIHGDHVRLESTLRQLGYVAKPSQTHFEWSHPDGLIALFLGDFIDGGPANRRVLNEVRHMVDIGSARAIMGNHELNALLYHRPNVLGTDWLRPRSAANQRQHHSFLAEFAANDDNDVSPPRDLALAQTLAWFMTLPLFLDLGAFRLVHAQWHGPSIKAISKHLSALGRTGLVPKDLDEVAALNTDFGRAVDVILKGLEIPLPLGITFADFHGKPRDQMRLKWWAQGDPTYRNMALSVPNPRDLPETLIENLRDGLQYGPGDPPVLVGHYKMTGKPQIFPNEPALSLDYPGTPCAYIWHPEDKTLRNDRILIVK